MSADRNLLFGMLALHAGLITREQLLEAFNAWMLDKGVALGEILQARGALDADDRRMLDGLVERQVKRHGDERRSLASMCVDPAARRDLERLADADVQASLASVGPAEHTTTNGVASAGRVAGAECPGGGETRYRKLRFHARGGLGEVSVALDEELRREVALKEIQERFADDDGSRRRFLREAEITGNLEHPGVVPVYGLLAHPGGRPVYAMRFIKGETLHDAIGRFHAAEKPGRDPGERSLSLRGLLTRFVAVCNAVGYAHSRGVIHRDLKPQNVMLGEYGETIVVDWGLARVLVQTDPEQTTPYSLLRVEGDTATELGKALGTPAYMPPEQARCEHERVGVASDVFALGATLYSLLTGKAPYRDLERAKEIDFAPPRQVNARVPRALEAVCRKAMAAKTEDRYATARALAEDVDHWLADEPVQAYREPVVDRLRRWGRRNRTVAASGLMLLLASVVGLSAGLWAVNKERTRTKAQWERAEENLGRALEAEREAMTNFEQARKAVDDCFGLVKDDPLLQAKNLRKVRQVLLRKTLPFYESFAAKKPDDEALLARQADYLRRVGYVTAEIDRKADGLRSYLQAREILLGLSQAHPDITAHQADLAQTWNSLGILQLEMGNPEEAVRSCEQAREILLGLAEAHPEVTTHQSHLATTLGNLGNFQSATGEPEAALRSYLQARDILLRLSKAHPEETEHHSDLAGIWVNLGAVQSDTGRPNEALKSYLQAKDVLLWLSKAHPEVERHQTLLAGTWNNLGDLQSETGDCEEALRSYERARDILLRFSRSHPDVTDHQAILAQVYVNLSLVQRQAGKADQALKSVNQAIPLLLALRQRDPEHFTYRFFLRNAHGSRGEALAQLGRHRDAVADFDEALRLNHVPTQAAIIRLSRADALARAGDSRRAMAEVEDLARGQALAGESLYNLSCAAALSAAAIARDAGRPLPERDKQAEAWSRQAVELLQLAAKTGYFRESANRAHLDKDADVAFLRGRDDFRAFVASLPAAKPSGVQPNAR